MAGEWVGVVGAALGAGIGGVVTVSSLIVKGRQDAAREQRIAAREDERRRAEMEREDRLRRLEDRRTFYVDLLLKAERLYRSLDFLESDSTDGPPDSMEASWKRARAAHTDLAAMGATVQLASPSLAVLEAFGDLVGHADDAIDFAVDDFSLACERSCYARGGYRDLRRACRAEMGLEVPPAERGAAT